MKTTTMLMSCFLLAAGAVNAQSSDSAKDSTTKISLTIVKEQDGKKTVIDTTFYGSDDSSYRDFLKEHDISMSMDPDDKDRREGSGVMKFRYDSGRQPDEQEIVIVRPGAPHPPLPPLPPLPGHDEEARVFSYQYNHDHLDRDMKELEKMMEENFGDRSDFQKKIKKMEIRVDDKKTKKGSRKGTKKIIIIEQE
ncbi:MAG: hypothetical protein JNL88_07645 [Bacteroidia bacterium]|nr:hypothetical protein [Bacteroidia bacterium]